MAVTKEIRDAISRIEQERMKAEKNLRDKEISERQKYNLMILDELKKIFINDPDLRFGQVVSAFCLGDNPVSFFNDEPHETFNNLKNSLK